MSLGGVGDRDFTPPWRQPLVKKLDKYTDFNWRPTRGGKKTKKQQELAERVARGEYVPTNLAQAGNFRVWWANWFWSFGVNISEGYPQVKAT